MSSQRARVDCHAEENQPQALALSPSQPERHKSFKFTENIFQDVGMFCLACRAAMAGALNNAGLSLHKYNELIYNCCLLSLARRCSKRFCQRSQKKSQMSS